MGHRNDRRAKRGWRGTGWQHHSSYSKGDRDAILMFFFGDYLSIYIYIYILYTMSWWYMRQKHIIHITYSIYGWHLVHSLSATFLLNTTQCLVYCIIDLRLLKYVSFLGSFERKNVLVASMDVQTDNASGHGQRYDHQSGWFFWTTSLI